MQNYNETSAFGRIPLVSIYIATKDRRTLLERAISSALQQTYPNIEVVVTNDGSKDSTRAYLEQISRSDRRIKIINHATSKGACISRNVALRACNGEFVTGLDDDDFFTKDRIAHFVAIYSDKWSFICSNTLLVTSYIAYESAMTDSVITIEDIKMRNKIGSQIFIKKERILDIGGYDEAFAAWQDYDLWFRLVKEYGSALKIHQCTYVVDTSSAQHRISNSSNAHAGYMQFIEKHGKLLNNKEILSQKINDLCNRNEKIALIDIMRLSRSISTTARLVNLYVRSRWPKLYYRIISLFLRPANIECQ